MMRSGYLKELENILRPEEQLALKLRKLYRDHHFKPYHLSSFEEYDLYNQAKNYLNDAEVITFTGGDGRIMALKPDITLSIVKNTPNQEVRKVYYDEDVYRHDRQNEEYLRIHQIGLEYIGEIHKTQEVEVLALAIKSLSFAGNGVLDLSHMGVLQAVCTHFPRELEEQVIQAIQQKSGHQLQQLAKKAGLSVERRQALADFMTLSGEFEAIYPKALEILQLFDGTAPLEELYSRVASLKEQQEIPKNVTLRLDFSIVNDTAYYSGLLFQGFIESTQQPFLFGGRYDTLLQRQGKKQSGIGFGITLKRNGNRFEETPDIQNNLLRIALPKGRMAEKTYQLLVQAGLASENIFEENRKLIVEDIEKNLQFFLVKPSDVAIYVEHGVADLGVIGKDVLDESQPSVYELLDLKMGACRLCIAAHDTFQIENKHHLRVATKYPRVTRQYFASKGQSVELIRLHGSIELAPLLGLSDVIVDIVETGTTLKENELKVIGEISESSARLIANASSLRFKDELIQEFLEKVKGTL